MDRKRNFKKGEVVWAKIRGFPWWPGVIQSSCSKHDNEKDNGNKALVNFIGDNTHAFIQLEFIEKYQKYYDEYKVTKKKSLQTAIELADKIEKKELSFEQAMSSHNLNEHDKPKTKIMEPKQAKADKPCNSDSEEETTKVLSSKRKREEAKEPPINLQLIPRKYKLKNKRQEDSTQDIEHYNDELIYKKDKAKTITSFKKYNNYKSDSESSTESQIDLKKEIQSLIYNRINLRASSNGKNLLEKFENIQKQAFESPNFHKLVKDLMALLNSFSNNKNKIIQRKTDEIHEKLQKKIMEDLFIDTQKIEKIKLKYELTKKDVYDMVQQINSSEEYINKQGLNVGLCGGNINMDDLTNPLKDFSSIEKDLILGEEVIEEAEEIVKDEEEKEIIRGNTIKGKVEEKIQWITFNDTQIYEVFRDFIAGDSNIAKQNFADKLRKGGFFNNQKPTIHIEKVHLRRNICHHLYKILKKTIPSIEDRILQKIIIEVERKAREKDMKMNKVYKVEIKRVFEKLKKIIYI